MNTDSGRPASSFGLLGLASTMGMHMISGPLVGGALGWLADRWLDSWPWGLGVGVVLGIVAGFRNVWADAERLRHGQEELDASEAAQREEEAKKAREKASGPRVPKRSFLSQKGEEVAPLPPDDKDEGLPESKAAELADMARLQSGYRELVDELSEESGAPVPPEQAVTDAREGKR